MRKKYSLAVAALFATLASAQAPDNSAVNQRDRGKSALTAEQQKGSVPDRELTRKIRRAIYKDKSLSVYAHNVKIISRNGAVTLKGPVRSEEEKKTVESHAAEVAGADKITSELTVAPGKSGKARQSTP